jgi:hypothetical protein
MSQATLKLRHQIVKLFAPKLYADWGIFFATDNIKLERPMISFVKKRFGNNPLVGCEIGTREGINALRMLKTLNIKRLYLVDPYLPYFEPLIAETQHSGYHKTTEAYARQLLKDYVGKIVWVKQTSDDALPFISDHLDFCYIDGDHSGEQVKRDIENYGKLIVSGGVLGGHDFNLAYNGLCSSVLEVFKSNALLTDLSGAFFDWWFIKK